jgi:poly(hydroxyalkanoate) depolymerase family esterase
VPDTASRPPAGEFLGGSFTNEAGTREYKLYIPVGFRAQQTALVVMLHGCTQDPDDFAAGTRMNALADEKGILVAYPAQAATANTSRCWNWFNAADQLRDQGEPSIIAGVTRRIMAEYPIDPRRVFIAGMSAGGALAAIMAVTYPDLYAAVGIHSGMPFGSVKDLFSALAAMRYGATTVPTPPAPLMPLIVFHGEHDKTVNPFNGERLVAQWLAPAAAQRVAAPTIENAESKGRAYRRTTYHDRRGHVIVEYWAVRGLGHGWSGGSRAGSHTDPRGPDASREMLRFFLGAQDKAGGRKDGLRRRIVRGLEALRNAKSSGAPDAPTTIA